MSETFYRKVGRKYVPVREYDDEFYHALPYGTHMIMVKPNGRSTRWRIDPDYASMVAAGLYVREAVVDAVMEISRLEPVKTPMTPEQIEAWRAFNAAMGDSIGLRGTSAWTIAEAATDKMQECAADLLKNESVRAAWEQFMMVCKLAKDTESK